MPPVDPRRKKAFPVSKVGILLTAAVCAFLVFEVSWHQRIRQSALAARLGDSSGTDSSGTGSTARALTTTVQSSSKASLASSASQCHMEPHNEYHGAVVLWGDKNPQETAEGCCKLCQDTPTCNVWVYCPRPEGCGDANSPRPHKECWLKRAEIDELLENVIGRGHPGISWASGAVYTDQELKSYQAKVADKQRKEDERRKALRDNPELPLVYLDVAIDGKPVGRIELVLFMKESPRAAENMRVLCSGEQGAKLHLKGAQFYRIIDRFIDQTGIDTSSIYGTMFKDDEGGLKLQHDRPYLLSMANGGPNTNTAHFSITVAPAHHLDGHYTIFGEAVTGFSVIERVNALSRGQKNNELLHSGRAKITDAGQLRKGTYRPSPEALKS